MSVMISKDKKELIVSCHCGCDEGLHIVKINQMNMMIHLRTYLTFLEIFIKNRIIHL